MRTEIYRTEFDIEPLLDLSLDMSLREALEERAKADALERGAFEAAVLNDIEATIGVRRVDVADNDKDMHVFVVTLWREQP